LAALDDVQTNGEKKIDIWKIKIKELQNYSDNLAINDSD